MKEFIIRDGKKLRLGYTTGSCAAAAAKAAAWMLLSGSEKESIRLLTPKGMELTLAVEDIRLSPNCVRCAIRKDSGDDPDITAVLVNLQGRYRILDNSSQESFCQVHAVLIHQIM